MPSKYICKNCKEVLYEGDLIKNSADLIKTYEGKCPRCGQDLRKPGADDVEVNIPKTPYKEKPKGRPPGKGAGKSGKTKP